MLLKVSLSYITKVKRILTNRFRSQSAHITRSESCVLIFTKPYTYSGYP